MRENLYLGGVKYKKVEYIQLSQKAEVLLGLVPNNTIKWQVKLKTATADGGQIVGGTYRNGEESACRLFNYNNTIYLDYGSGEGGNRIYGSRWNNNTIYNFEVGNRYVKNLDIGANLISGSSVGAFNYSQGDFGVFASDTTTTIYYIKVWLNDALVRDCVPVKDANGIFGLYDSITDEFYGKGDTGVITGGEEI